MSTTLLALGRLIAKELGYLSGTCSAAGSTTTIVDASANSKFDTFDDDTLLSSAWAKIEADTAGTPLNVGEVRRIKEEGGYTPASSTVTTARAFSNATTTTQSYGIYLGVPPVRVGPHKGIDEYINEVLRLNRYRHYSLLTLITDGDMETSGVTNWTSTNSSSSKITTAAKVGMGKQALQVTTSAANGYVQSAAVPVAGARTMQLIADVAANTGTAKLQLWDATNSAEIASVSTTSRAPTTLWVSSANVPSTCYSVVVRLIGVASGDVAVWDNVSLRPGGAMSIALPSWVNVSTQVERVQYSVDRGVSLATGATARDSREMADVFSFNVIEDFGAANAFRVSVSESGRNGHLFAVCLRYFGELSADTDTTDMDSDWLKWEALVNIWQDKGETNKAQRAAAEARKYDMRPRWKGKPYKPVMV